MRDGNPRNEQNWKMVCSHCGTEWGMKENISLTEGHYQEEHPDQGIAFSIIWVGKGPAPKGGYPGKQQVHRRRRR